MFHQQSMWWYHNNLINNHNLIITYYTTDINNNIVGLLMIVIWNYYDIFRLLVRNSMIISHHTFVRSGTSSSVRFEWLGRASLWVFSWDETGSQAQSGDFGERMMGRLYVIRFHMDFTGIDIWIVWDGMGFVADLCWFMTARLVFEGSHGS